MYDGSVAIPGESVFRLTTENLCPITVEGLRVKIVENFITGLSF